MKILRFHFFILCIFLNSYSSINAQPCHLEPFLKEEEESLFSTYQNDLFVLDALIKINSVFKGETRILIDDTEKESTVLIDPIPIRTLIKKYMSDESYKQCFDSLVSVKSFVEPFTLENGFSICFNEEDQTVEVFIPTIFIKLQLSSLCENAKIDPSDLIPPAPFSFYANFYLEKNFNYLRNCCTPVNKSPVSIACDYCFHQSMWTLEGDFNFGNSCYTNELYRNTILTKDIPEQNLRYGFGYVNPTIIGLQKNFGLIGASIDFNPLYFKDCINSTCQDELDFFLTKVSRVEVLVNGMSYKVLRLPPGPHRLLDLPCITGCNEITLKINDDIEETHYLDFTYSYNPCSIQEGLGAYSLGFGIPYCQRTCSYQWSTPAFTSSYIYGVTPRFSSGGFFQISTKNFQVGSENIWLTPYCKIIAGCGLFWVFQDHANFQGHLSFDNSSCYSNNHFRWSANFHYFGKPLLYDFSKSKNCHQNYYHHDTAQIAASINASYRLWDSYFLSTGLNSTVNQRWKTEYGVNASLSKNFNSYFSASVSGYLNFNSPNKNLNGCIFTISTNAPEISLYNNTCYSSERAAYYNQTSWSGKVNENTALGLSFSAEEAPNQQMVSSNACLNHTRFTASAIANTTKLKRSCQYGESIYNGCGNLSIGTCLLYADGCYAISRPNYDSFIIVKPKPEISSYGIEVNNHSYLPRGIFPAVLENQGAYDTICVDVFSENLPVGYNFGKNYFCCKTEYKSGTLLLVGEGKSYLVIGKLLCNDTPLKYCIGYVVNQSDENQKKIEFFTNRSGDFQIEALEEGSYCMYITGYECTASFTVIPNEEGIIELEPLNLLF